MQESHVVVVVDSPEFNPELKVKGLISDFFFIRYGGSFYFSLYLGVVDFLYVEWKQFVIASALCRLQREWDLVAI